MTSTIDIPSLITDEASAQGVPPSIALAVAQQESGMNQGAVGSSGEIGVFQLLPSSFPGVDSSDVFTNVETGISYLSSLFQRFSDWATALAAYNAGPGNVSQGNIPASTQQYVNNVLNMASTTYASADGSDSVSAADGPMPASSSLDFSWLTSPAIIAPAILLGLAVAGWMLAD